MTDWTDWRHRPTRRLPDSAEAWDARRLQLLATIRYVERGHGIDKRMYPIQPFEARSWSEYEDACELLALEHGLDKPIQNDKIEKSAYFNTIRIVLWARETIFYEGWGSIFSYACFSEIRKDYLIVTKRRYERYKARHQREWMRDSVHQFIRTELRGPCLTRATYPERFTQVFQLIKSGEHGQVGDRSWHACNILLLFEDLMDARRSRDFAYVTDCALRIGIIWGQYQMRSELEEHALGRRKQLSPFLEAAATAREAHNKEARSKAAQWQAEAARIASGSRLTGGALEQHVQRALERMGYEHRNLRTIRRALSILNRRPQ